LQNQKKGGGRFRGKGREAGGWSHSPKQRRERDAGDLVQDVVVARVGEKKGVAKYFQPPLFIRIISP
jgi:hypothetical protein